jgi:non-canonical (house-cleaning) NTP pyrophosphatase
MKAPSGVNEQPVKSLDSDEILQGAENRARSAKLNSPIPWVSHPGIKMVFVGIENGIEFTKSNATAIVFDLASVVLIDDNDCLHFANSAGHVVNYIDAEEARRRGFDKHTVASVTAERTGSDPNDATPYYTNGKITRADLLKQAVKLAVAQWMAVK